MSNEIEHLQDILITKLVSSKMSQKEIFNSLITLKNTPIFIIGAGGVGSICSELLVRAGFKKITIIDGDVVEKNNLGRQLYNYEDIGKLKVKCLKEKLLKIQNPSLNFSISQISQYIDKKNINKIISIEENKNYLFSTPIIIDCSDNLSTRRLINSFALNNNFMWIYSGGEGFESIVGVFDYSYSNSIDLFSKFITTNHIQTSNCSSGVLNSTTTITASLIVKELLIYKYNLLHCFSPLQFEQRENMNNDKKQICKCIKFNLLYNKVFEFYIK